MSAVKHQPATPMPWRVAGVEPSKNPFYPIVGKAFQHVAQVDIHARGGSNKDAEYIAHAANAYPKLVEALRGSRCLDGCATCKRNMAFLRELGEETE